MQPNVALSVEDGDAESPGHNIKPTELFAVKKSHSSSNIRETRLNSEAVTNPASVASSVPSVQ